MYDNNNNQNFNNGNGDVVRPLFENDFKSPQQNNNTAFNPGANYNLEYQNSSSPSFGYQGQPINAFENSFNPLSTQPTYMNNPYETSLNSQQSVQMDIPPELGEIKNLNDATKASAPTMDVLDPMNVINTAPNQPQDRLEAYESGNLNVLNNGTIPNGATGANSFNPPFTNQMSGNYYNPSLNQNNGQILSGQMNPFNQPVQNSQNNGFLNSFNPVPQQVSPNNSFDPSLLNTSLKTPFSNDLSSNEIPNEAPVMNQQNDTFNTLGTNDAINPSLLNETSIKEQSPQSPNPSDIVNESEELKTDDVKEVLPLSTDYQVIQDENLGEDKKEPQNLSDLGVENAYNEPDMLDIMDITDEEEGSQEQKTLSYNEIVDKIKKLIDDLKREGAKIDLEEFDFEQMYQLIIKLNK